LLLLLSAYCKPRNAHARLCCHRKRKPHCKQGIFTSASYTQAHTLSSSRRSCSCCCRCCCWLGEEPSRRAASAVAASFVLLLLLAASAGSTRVLSQRVTVLTAGCSVARSWLEACAFVFGDGQSGCVGQRQAAAGTFYYAPMAGYV